GDDHDATDPRRRAAVRRRDRDPGGRRPAGLPRQRPRRLRVRRMRQRARCGDARGADDEESPDPLRTLLDGQRLGDRRMGAPQSMTKDFVTGLVLAAGGSERLGQAKQLLSFGDATLLDHALDTVRACAFERVVCVLGGGAENVRARVNLEGIEVVDNPQFGTGCSSSIAAALNAVDPRTDVLVLLLADQPGVTPATVSALLAGRGGAPLAACAYDDGRGHPLAF